ncbi:MAG: DUF2085 domain-containing protein [Anaerolineae bacterium]|jgi:uncharacterized membrane protein|nr:DUF2085 domain-containing protein [Anaerolineae bacterium]
MEKPLPRFWIWLGIVLALAALLVFIFRTPPSLLRKADYIAAAVCHRIPSHSFFVDEHQLPLCQRCTGTFAGALTGLLFQWAVVRRRRTRLFPPLWQWLLMGGFAAIWGLDGFNSYTTLLLGRATGILGYAPQPWIRLFSGTLMGLGMSLVLVSAFNQVFWSDALPEAPLPRWRNVAPLLAAGLVQAAVIYTLEPWLLYPIALYSTAGVIAMMTCLGAMIWVMALRREQRYTGWREAWLPLVWGIVFAAIIIIGMGGVRLILTGSVDGIPGL